MYKKNSIGIGHKFNNLDRLLPWSFKNCHCANFRVCSKRQVFCHLFSWTCCIKVWNYWLKKTTTNFTMLSVQTVLLVSQYRIYIFIIHKIYMLHTFNMFCKCSFDRKEDHLPFFFSNIAYMLFMNADSIPENLT